MAIPKNYQEIAWLRLQGSTKPYVAFAGSHKGDAAIEPPEHCGQASIKFAFTFETHYKSNHSFYRAHINAS